MFNRCRGGVAGFVGALVLIVGVPSARGDTWHPAEEFQLKSHLPNGAETAVTFANRTRQVVRVYWLTFDGKRKLYKALTPDEEYSQHTFVGHPWVITDGNDNAQDLIFPELQSPARKKPRERRGLTPKRYANL